jgi:hypothetical protein
VGAQQVDQEGRLGPVTRWSRWRRSYEVEEAPVIRLTIVHGENSAVTVLALAVLIFVAYKVGSSMVPRSVRPDLHSQ